MVAALALVVPVVAAAQTPPPPPDPTVLCPPVGPDCGTIVVQATPSDSNGSGAIDAGDVVSVTVTVTASTTMDITAAQVVVGLPAGSGTVVLGDTMSVRGVPVSPGADGDAGEVTGAGVMFRLGTVTKAAPAVMNYGVRIGAYVAPATENPDFRLTGTLAAMVGTASLVLSDTSPRITMTQRLADLSISIADQAADLFLVTVTNLGLSEAGAPRSTIMLPPGVDVVVLPADGRCVQSGAIIECVAPNLAANTLFSHTLQLRSTTGGFGPVKAAVTSTTFDHNPDNNFATSVLLPTTADIVVTRTT